GHRQGSSKPLFPGAIQCADTNSLILMLADAQTTGGYAIVATLARVDAHLAGQVRPGDTVTLHRQTPADALAALAAKAALFRDWLPDEQWWR
ncbi:MAG: allophanate hydrolase, partial [Pseudomonadota bacterium]